MKRIRNPFHRRTARGPWLLTINVSACTRTRVGTFGKTKTSGRYHDRKNECIKIKQRDLLSRNRLHSNPTRVCESMWPLESFTIIERVNRAGNIEFATTASRHVNTRTVYAKGHQKANRGYITVEPRSRKLLKNKSFFISVHVTGLNEVCDADDY